MATSPTDSAPRIQEYCAKLSTNLNNKSIWLALAADVEAIEREPQADSAAAWESLQDLFRNVVWREIRAFWSAGIDPLPYLMYGSMPNHTSDVVSFDALGMRRTLRNGKPVDYDDFIRSPMRRGIVIGNSTAAGVGVSSDGFTMASVLNTVMPDVLWFNMSIGGHNIFQNALALDLLAPDKFDYLVVCAGLIDFLSPLTATRQQPSYLPAYLVPFQETDSRFDLAANGWSESAIQHGLRRGLEMMSDRVARASAQMLFMLQPHLGLNDKQLSPEERCMIATYAKSATRPVWKAHTHIQSHRAKITGSIKNACDSLGILFSDINRAPEFTKSNWLFLDYIHVNNAGHAHMAKAAQRLVNSLK